MTDAQQAIAEHLATLVFDALHHIPADSAVYGYLDALGVPETAARLHVRAIVMDLEKRAAGLCLPLYAMLNEREAA